MIPYSRQVIDEDDIAAVADALRSDWLTTGPYVERFEQSLADYTGARHAVTFSSGTAALHGCMHAARIGPGDRVATSPLSFSASANCARYVGAEPLFVDIDPRTLNLNVRSIPECDALVAVHYAGLPVDLGKLPKRPRVVVEDAAQALGAQTPDGRVGNCANSDMTVFSFHPVKSITTGEGGAVTTNDDGMAERLRRFRSHGIERRSYLRPWEYEINELGYNYRLTDVQAALGCSQMKKLEFFVAKRNELANAYDEALAEAQVQLPPGAPEGVRHARHLYPVRLSRRDDAYDVMRRAGIGVQVHHVPIYRLATYGCDGGRWPETERAYEMLLSLPLYPDLTEEQQSRIIAILGAFLG